MNSLYITEAYKTLPLKVGYRSLAYPLLLLFIALLIATLRWTGLPLEATLTIAFMASLLMLGINEILIPFRSDWEPDRREWLQNLAQFLPNGLLDNAGQLLAILIAMQLGSGEQRLPLLIAVPLAIVISEFFSYWTHRGTCIALWDRVFGTFVTPDKEPAAVGVAAPHAFPAPAELLKSQLFPFHRLAGTGGQQ